MAAAKVRAPYTQAEVDVALEATLLSGMIGTPGNVSATMVFNAAVDIVREGKVYDEGASFEMAQDAIERAEKDAG